MLVTGAGAARAAAGDAADAKPVKQIAKQPETTGAKGVILRICIPVNENKGLESSVCQHFGAAPLFLLIDTETEELDMLDNSNQHQAHGQCRPVAALVGKGIDGVVVGGIGMGAINRLRAGGTEVFISQLSTVAEVLLALREGRLKPAALNAACSGHGSGPGHGR
jgi:predicted Fe-Mo cluster-binding NifX family protein